MIVSVVTSWVCPCGETRQGVCVYDATIRIRQVEMRHVIGVRPKWCGENCQIYDLEHPDSYELVPEDRDRVEAARRKLRSRSRTVKPATRTSGEQEATRA